MSKKFILRIFSLIIPAKVADAPRGAGIQLHKSIKAKILIFLLLLLLCTLLVYPQTIQKEKNTPLPASAPTPNQPIESTLKFIPDEIHTNPGQTNELSIQINSQGKHPTLLQLELAYSPTTLTEISIKPLPNSNILLNNNDEKTGRISYAISLPNEKPLSYSEIPVVLKFKIKEDTMQKQTTLYFLPKTAVLSKGINIPIKIAYGAKILITAPF